MFMLIEDTSSMKSSLITAYVVVVVTNVAFFANSVATCYFPA